MSAKANGRKTAVYVILILAAVVVVLAVTTMALFAAVDKSAVTEGSNGETSVSALNIDDSEEYAKALFACAVTDINDSGAVVKLLEAMKFEENAGKYTAQISTADGGSVLDLKLSDIIKKEDREIFDENIKLCAQQMLALIPGIETVQWRYSVDTGSSSQEESKVSLSAEGATEELGSDVRIFGESAEQFQTLLSKQKNAE